MGISSKKSHLAVTVGAEYACLPRSFPFLRSNTDTDCDYSRDAQSELLESRVTECPLLTDYRHLLLTDRHLKLEA